MSTQLEDVKQKAGKILRRVLWIALAAFIIFGIGYYVQRTWVISDGHRTGVLFKISKKGAVIKTYEGQLLLAGAAMMTQQSVWDFSAKNEAVYQQLSLNEGKTVVVHYKQLQRAFIWQGETDYIVDEVEVKQ
jgi:hypothetical protein